MNNFKIREIKKSDDRVIERIIRDCLIEYGADHEGTAWADPDLSRFSEIYNTKDCRYFVAENEAGEVVGGVGIGRLGGTDRICELQKMYCVPSARGTGVAGCLLKTALSFAARFYNAVYLETLNNMHAAMRFYEKHGFRRCEKIGGVTEHFACDICYIKDL